MFGRGPVYHPSSPLSAIRAKVHARVEYNPGTDLASASALARASDVAIVFAVQPATEGRDLPGLALPDEQDKLIGAVAAANRHTIVVLETGGPVSMPWIENVSAVLEAWYPGIRGAEAVANILFGDVNPSAKLCMTFAKSEADLPHPTIPAPPPPPPGATPAPAAGGRGGRGPAIPFDIPYTEGLKVGYKWYDAQDRQPLFPFGFGLSYTTYSYRALKTTPGAEPRVSFTVTNTGRRAGAEIAQVYVSFPPNLGEPPRRLVAWDKVQLAPGETKTVNLALDRLHLSIFNAARDAWEVLPGEYKVFVGASSRETPLSATLQVQ